jgi:hypothetical protein
VVVEYLMLVTKPKMSGHKLNNRKGDGIVKTLFGAYSFKKQSAPLGSNLYDQTLRTSQLDKVIDPLCVTTRIGTCENNSGFSRHLHRVVVEIEKYH